MADNYAGKSNSVKNYARVISVEVTMFLYMLAFMTTTVVEQNFFLHKACRVNNNFSANICDHIKDSNNTKYKRQVQLTIARFYQWESIMAHIFPIILAFFLGSFSDRRGRKFPLLMGLCGKLYYSLMIVLNARMTSWPLEYVLYTATFPAAITGSDVAIFASCFAYISDITTVHNRTLRITILDACYLSAMPLGLALGSYLFQHVFPNSHANMFLLNSSFMIASIIYTIVWLEWQTTIEQRPLKEVGFCGFFGDFFDWRHVKDSFTLLTKSPNNVENQDNSHQYSYRRSCLLLLLLAMCFYTFQREENQYMFLYTTFKFKWGIDVYSTFKTIKSSAYVLAMLLAVPIMNKCFHWKDTTAIFVGASAHIVARFFYYFANSGTIFYIGAIVCSLGPIVGPMIRSVISKLVAQSERGKIFALLSVCDNATPFISGVIYSQVYQITLTKDGIGGNGVFLLTIASQLIVFLINVIICILLKRAKGNEQPINDVTSTSVEET